MTTLHRPKRSSRTKSSLKTVLCGALLVALACAPAVETVDKPIESGPMVACCSATGHNPNNIPFALGGNCFCTPSATVVEAMHAAGFHQDVDYKKLVQTYKDRDITTDLDHRGCNNLCDHGPHVAFGGKCVATPTPGTRNYERVLRVTAEQVAAVAGGM